MSFESYFIPLILTANVPYPMLEWPSWISSLMIMSFQTGNGSYTTWMCLQYAIKYQKHSRTSQSQMWLMPFPIYFNAFPCPRFTPHSFNLPEHLSLLVLRGYSNSFTYLSYFILSKILGKIYHWYYLPYPRLSKSRFKLSWWAPAHRNIDTWPSVSIFQIDPYNMVLDRIIYIYIYIYILDI